MTTMSEYAALHGWEVGAQLRYKDSATVVVLSRLEMTCGSRLVISTVSTSSQTAHDGG